jgi:hypothetical protein
MIILLFFPLLNYARLVPAAKPATHLIYVQDQAGPPPPDYPRRIRVLHPVAHHLLPVPLCWPSLEACCRSPIIPLLVPHTCVLSSHLAHGLTLPDGTDRVRICPPIRKSGERLSAGLLRRVQESCGGGEQPHGSGLAANSWEEICGGSCGIR